MTDTPDGARGRWLFDDPIAIALAARDGGWFCAYCRVPLVSGHDDLIPSDVGIGEGFYAADGRAFGEKDHVIPKSRGGSNELENLVLSCSKCNQRKGARTPEEWKAAAA